MTNARPLGLEDVRVGDRCLACDSSALVTFGDHVRCRRCGLVAGDLSPTTETTIYRDLVASGGAARIERHRRPFYETVLARFAPLAAAGVLDVGCGTGEFVRLAAQRGWRAVGIDPAGDDVDERGVRLVRGSFPPETDAAPPLADLTRAVADRFGLVTFFNSLNYAPDPLAVLGAARARLVPGGAVVIRVPNVVVHGVALAVGRHARAIPVVGRWLRATPRLHPRSFSPKSLAVLLGRAGFRDVRVEPSPPIPGDPYASAAALGLVKVVVGVVATAVSRASRGAVVCTPSLLAIGRRPPLRESAGPS